MKTLSKTLIIWLALVFNPTFHTQVHAIDLRLSDSFKVDLMQLDGHDKTQKTSLSLFWENMLSKFQQEVEKAGMFSMGLSAFLWGAFLLVVKKLVDSVKQKEKLKYGY